MFLRLLTPSDNTRYGLDQRFKSCDLYFNEYFVSNSGLRWEYSVKVANDKDLRIKAGILN